MYKDVIILASSDWNDFWFQRQQFAKEFALLGHKVYYFNRTLQRFPKFSHLKRRIRSLNEGNQIINPIPTGIKVITSLLLPPYKFFRVINKILIRKSIRYIKFNNPLVITYVPTYNALDFIEIIKPVKTVYINVHRYEFDTVITDVLKAEQEMLKIINYLFGDSFFNRDRLKKLSGKEDIHLSQPGVDFSEFNKAYRNGEEIFRKQKIFYYGGIGKHIDLDLYNKLAEIYEVTFIGRVANEVKNSISPKIIIYNGLRNDELPSKLVEADILTIFYKNSEYIKGVIPAKLFECFATLKPLLVCGIDEAKHYKEALYYVENNYSEVKNIIDNLKISETATRINERKRLAKEADWSNRFQNFKSIIDD